VPVHLWLHNQLEAEITAHGREKRFTVHSMTSKGGELTLSGIFADKRVDIAILDHQPPVHSPVADRERVSRPAAAIGFKFILSNYKQNANNYFEQNIGEIVNLRVAKISYVSVLVLPINPPYFNESGRCTRTEHVSASDVRKYLSLATFTSEAFAPNRLFLFLVRYDPTPESRGADSKLRLAAAKDVSGLDPSEIRTLNELRDIEHFARETIALI
jgi:hypothetical protein